MAVAAALPSPLPPCTAMVATKTPAATAMVGAQTTKNNQLKAAVAMVTEIAMITAMTTMMQEKAKTASSAAWRWQRQQAGVGRSAAAQ